ncbi:hypothetical protein HaLaN_27160, partial [Haematococcus lacustris]
MVAWAYGAMRMQASRLQLALAARARVVVARGGQLGLQTCVMLLWGAARQATREQELLLQAPHRFKLADIATIMWAMTSLRHRSDAVADSVTRHVLRHLAAPVAGRDGATPSSDTAEDPHALLPHLHQAGDAEHLASLVHSMAALSYYDPVLFKVAAAVIEPDLDLLDTEQLVQLIWAYAVTITDAATYAEPDENPRQLHDRCAVGGSGQSEVGAHCRLLRAAAEMLAASAPSVTYGLTPAEVFALLLAEVLALGTPGQPGGPGARMGAGQRRHMANLAKSLAGEGWQVSNVERGWGAEDPMAGLLTSSGAWCGAVKGGVKLAVLLQGAEHVTSTRPRQLMAEHQ